MADRDKLPIWKYKDDLVQAFNTYNQLVIVGDTGSGKTTQVPPLLLAHVPEVKTIAITQPRRIAAISAARRVAEELKVPLGTKVGYAIRFERKAAPNTHITYMTDGLLLREAAADPLMTKYDCVILDEAHERSLETDVLFGLLKVAAMKRSELRVYIMSATLDVEKFSDFLGQCPVFSIPGRMFDVDIFYLKKMKLGTLKATYIQRSVDTVLHIHKNEEPGDVLVFLTGQNEIEQAMKRLEDELDELNAKDIKYGHVVRNLIAHPIYSALETMEQRAIFDPPPRDTRKVIFATNIAQTSVTIPGIRYVVDSGFVKQKMYDPQTSMDALLVVPVSQAAATQRAGRAGRTDVGKVYRLYSRDAFEQMDPDTMPEIQRSSLIGTVLTLKQLGISDILGFDFIDPPDPTLVIAALKQLYLLGALDDDGRITELGRIMHALPVSPYLARFLIASARDFYCSREAVVISSMLSVEDVFINPRGQKKQSKAEEARREFHHSSGDHMTLYNLYEAYQHAEGNIRDWCRDHFIHNRAMRAAENIHEQLLGAMEKCDLTIVSCKSRGEKRARLDDGRRQSLHTSFDVTPILRSLSSMSDSNTDASSISTIPLVALFVSPQSALFTPLELGRSRIDHVIYQDIQYSNKANMRMVSAVRSEWIQEELPKLGQVDERRLTSCRLIECREASASLTQTAGDETGEECDAASSINCIAGKPSSEEDADASGALQTHQHYHHKALVSKESFEVVRELIDEVHHAERRFCDGVILNRSTADDSILERRRVCVAAPPPSLVKGDEDIRSTEQTERESKKASALARFLSRTRRK
ncbi:hypothetical protein SeMB42_g00374 [Synchytrium endobioticum]|uniref:RNA helicase n=1 Tax=Synchytrium endobioticum TaxID=286115 RepID=A0A507DSS9_9FUNG|nr:hypothetical protein SeMB42_g00374 [Synchytrium endobioticum]